MRADFWTTLELAACREMASAGHSSAEIGKILHRSRNSVIGMCYRNKITLKLRKYKKAAKPTGTLWRRAKENLPNIAKYYQDPLKSHALEKLRTYGWQCRFIVNTDTRNPIWCPMHAVNGYSWCKDHILVCYQKTAA